MIIFRYLCREVLGTLIAATLILLLIFISNQFVRYLNEAAAGEITIRAVVQVMSLQVPILLGYLLPLGLFLGLLLTLGRMTVDHELVVLSACGISRGRIVAMVMILATFVMIVVAWLMLWVEPRVQHSRENFLAASASQATFTKIVPGRFQTLGNNQGRVFYAAETDRSRKVLQDVFLAENSNMQLANPSWTMVSADQAKESQTPQGVYVVFENGYRYVGQPGQLNFTTTRFKQYGILLNPPIQRVAGNIQAQFTSDLWQKFSNDNAAAAELQWRLAMPISVLVFALLAVPLSKSNPRKGKFAQMFPAVVIYILYANLMFVSRGWIENGSINPWLGLWWVQITLCLIAGIFYFFQSSWWQKLKYR